MTDIRSHLEHRLPVQQMRPLAKSMVVMSSYLDFQIETFELGPNQWHACFRHVDRSKPIVIDGITLGKVHVGIAWPTADVALADARGFIDLMIGRFEIA